MKNVNLGYWDLWQSTSDVLKDYAIKNGYETYVNKWFVRGIIINGDYLIIKTRKLVNGELIVDFKIDADPFFETK